MNDPTPHSFQPAASAQVELRCWAPADLLPAGEPRVLTDAQDLPENLQDAWIVMPAAGAERAGELLSRKADRVLVGEAALRDSELVGKLAARHGSERIGVYVPARRMLVSWSLDTQSNADFKFMTPSVCEPCWEILMADGARTGTRVSWWGQEMIARGASCVLVAADIEDDADLNISGNLAEAWGERYWWSPRTPARPDLAAIVECGVTRRLVLPAAVYEGDPAARAWRGLEPLDPAQDGAATVSA